MPPYFLKLPNHGLLKPSKNSWLSGAIAETLSRTEGVQSVTYGIDHIVLYDGTDQPKLFTTAFIQVHPKIIEKRLGPFVSHTPAISFNAVEELLVGKGLVPPRKKRIVPLFYGHPYLSQPLDSGTCDGIQGTLLFQHPTETVFIINGKIGQEDLEDTIRLCGDLPGKVIGFQFGHEYAYNNQRPTGTRPERVQLQLARASDSWFCDQ